MSAKNDQGLEQKKKEDGWVPLGFMMGVME
jgi:hypothetical protein